MTKERRLAIQLWCIIREKVRRRKRPICGPNIHNIKVDFCNKHNIKWRHKCWFCQYIRDSEPDVDEGCQRCPLADKTDEDVMAGRKCGCDDGIYQDVFCGETVAERVFACNLIIQALRGKNPYEEG